MHKISLPNHNRIKYLSEIGNKNTYRLHNTERVRTVRMLFIIPVMYTLMYMLFIVHAIACLVIIAYAALKLIYIVIFFFVI